MAVHHEHLAKLEEVGAYIRADLADFKTTLRDHHASCASIRPTGLVITRAELRAMSPAEKVDAYRGMIRGELVLDLDQPPTPRPPFDRAAFEAMSPAERVAEYRSMIRSRL